MPQGADGADLTSALGQVADPDLALLGAVRLVEADPAAGQVLAEPGTARDRGVGVLGGSSALGDHLVRHPEHVTVLADPEPFGPSRLLPLRDHLTERLVAAVTGLTGREGMDALRVAYRRELLLIAAVDLAAE